MTGPPSLPASLLLATAAPAFTRPECPHGFVHDMGYGIVARRSVDVDELGEITAAAGLITDCVSGRTLAVKLNLPDLGGSEFDTHEIARGPGIQRGGQP